MEKKSETHEERKKGEK